MASPREIFNISGPIHLRGSLDWSNFINRTSVASCLVQAVYTLERDIQQNRMIGHNAQAVHWWEFFGFTLAEPPLIDQSDGSIYGAVFKFMYCQNYDYQNTHPREVPPRYVIAFRGTILTSETLVCDVEHDIRCIFDTLHHGTRFVQAVQAIQTTLSRYGPTAVWLAGHSLGAGLALLAGKTMAMFGCPLEAYIFNPPVSSIPLEQLVESDDLRSAVRRAGDIVKAGIARALGYNEDQEDDSFMKLASWIPNVYVNPSDPICSGYIGYFNDRSGMSERIATRFSLRGLLFGGGGSSSPYSSSPERLHFLPSAFMTINMTQSPDFKTAHGIHQWWDPRFIGEYALYQFDS